MSSHEARSEPAVLAGLDSVQEIRGLSPHGFCARQTDGSLWCWGFGYTGDVSTPVAGVTPRQVARDVSAKGVSSCEPWSDGTAIVRLLSA